MSRRPTRAGVHRIPVVVVVAVLLAGLVALDRGRSSTSPTIAHRASAVDGPTVPSEDAVSVAWFCSEGTSFEGGRADETILIANLAPHEITATVTVMLGATEPFVVVRRRLEAFEQKRVPVSELVVAEQPGVVVEVLGGPAIVEHELRGNGDVAVSPCARAGSRDWYFASGTTVRGAQEWLTLFNPFGQDAIVDVSFLTATRREVPGATQSLPVPRHSRVSLAVDLQVLREERLAIEVHATIGRIVADRTLIFDGTDTRRGLAVSLGANSPATRWRLPIGDGQPGTAQSISIANFALHPSTVDVSVTLDGESALDPVQIDVNAASVVRVELGDRVPVATSYTIDVRVTDGAPVVVEAFGTWAVPAPVTGVATTFGSVSTAKRWTFAVGRIDDEADAVFSAINVSNRPLTVELYAYTAGDPDSPFSTPARAVAPGERAEFRFSEIGILPNQVIVIQADGPIVVGRLILGSGASMSPGVPDLNF